MEDEELINRMSKETAVEPKPEPSGKVIVQRKLFTMTVINIYPNGNMFVDRSKSKSWFTDQEQVQRKPKAKPKPNKPTKMNSLESY